MFSLLQCLCDTNTLMDICKYASTDGTRRTCQDLKKVLVNQQRRQKRNPRKTIFLVWQIKQCVAKCAGPKEVEEMWVRYI